MLGTAAHQYRLAQGVLAEFDRADLLGQPPGDLVLVAARELAELERGADLRPVVLDRAPRPAVASELAEIDPDLLGDIGHRSHRDLVCALGEAGVDLEELQHQREAEPGRAGLVADQQPVLADQRPRRDQLIR